MIAKFLSYTEIKTKITSLFAFLISIAYLFYVKQSINWYLTLIFFAAMFIFDLTTTAINNYVDTKTNDQKLQFSRKSALFIIYAMFIISMALGLYLAYLTDIIILIIGAICFFFGVIYTYGPVPISRQPLGELFSGIFYGFFIPFILLYINMPKGTYLTYALSSGILKVNFMLLPLISLALLSVIPVCTTANIMLANNICDVKKDIEVKRFTLPYYLGRNSLHLFAALYYLTYIAVIFMVIFDILSPVCLLFLLTLIVVQKNIREFYKVQDKATTFLNSIKNYVIIMGAITLLIFVSGLFR